MKTTICKDKESCSCFGEGGEDIKDTEMNMQEGVEKCVKGGKWFMLIPGFLLISVFLLTYFLSPESGRILWLVITGTFIGLGLLFMALITLGFRETKKQVIG